MLFVCGIISGLFVFFYLGIAILLGASKAINFIGDNAFVFFLLHWALYYCFIRLILAIFPEPESAKKIRRN